VNQVLAREKERDNASSFLKYSSFGCRKNERRSPSISLVESLNTLGSFKRGREKKLKCIRGNDEPVASVTQRQFDRVASDVLLSLDCDYASSAPPRAGRGVPEMIAAYGCEPLALGQNSQWSFTEALTGTLLQRIDRPFLAVMLRTELLSILKWWQPVSSMPVHITASEKPDMPSILLSSVLPKAASNNPAQKAASPRCQLFNCRAKECSPANVHSKTDVKTPSPDPPDNAHSFFFHGVTNSNSIQQET